jgi:hypothetical protein
LTYIQRMARTTRRLTAEEVATGRKRRLEAMLMQEIEGNPLDAEDIAMFEMFRAQGMGWHRCREYILAQVRVPAK